MFEPITKKHTATIPKTTKYLPTKFNAIIKNLPTKSDFLLTYFNKY